MLSLLPMISAIRSRLAEQDSMAVKQSRALQKRKTTITQHECCVYPGLRAYLGAGSTGLSIFTAFLFFYYITSNIQKKILCFASVWQHSLSRCQKNYINKSIIISNLSGMKCTNLLEDVLCCGWWSAVKVDTDSLAPFQKVPAQFKWQFEENKKSRLRLHSFSALRRQQR